MSAFFIASAAYAQTPPCVDTNGDAVCDLAGTLGAATRAARDPDFPDLPTYAPLPSDLNLNEPLQAMFAPDDPNVTLELEMIDRVVQARKADPNTYTEGENPYRIRYAVYNLRNPFVTKALADAEDDGVDVQILIDGKQLDPARDWNVMDEYLVDERHFEFAPSHIGLSDADKKTKDLIGIELNGYRLMHLKTRLFHTPDFAGVITGSMNPGDNAVMNEETFHLIRDPWAIERYNTAFETVRDGGRMENVWKDGAAINVLFTPQTTGPRAGAQLLKWIEEEDEQILIMAFSLRDISAPGQRDKLVEILRKKADAGIPVYVITDRKQSDGVDVHGNPAGNNDPTEDRLREPIRPGGPRVHVYEATNARTDYTAMHHKVAILGRTDIRVVTDAANFTTAGLGSRTKKARHYESQLYIDTNALDDGNTGRRYMAQWLRVLERYASQTPEEPSYDEVFATLSAHPDWPKQTIRFRADNARTAWGEHIRVVGVGHPSLGRWGLDGDGIALKTDGSSYPTWTSDPIELPLGAVLSWKLNIGNPRSWRSPADAWESGGNRRLRVMPTVLSDDPTEIRATWRPR